MNRFPLRARSRGIPPLQPAREIQRQRSGLWPLAVLHCAMIAGLSFGSGSTTARAAEAPALAAPAAPLREMTTDRPDATESPFTIDVGHVQVEADLASHARDEEGGERIRETSFGVVNVRLGISPRTEIGFFVTSLIRRTERVSGGQSITRKGFGDMVVRGKFNGWGNDGGRSAGGVIVDLVLPTAADELGGDGLQGAVLLPLSVDLGEGWGMGAMTGLDFRREADGSGYQTVLLTTATLGRDLTDQLGAFLELTSEAGDGRHVATFNAGLTYRVHSELQLDAGVNTGISEAANDMEVFVGLSRRY